MPQNPSGVAAEDERAELERVVGALSRWPRLSDLLRYMGDRLLSGEVDQINEYNIATEVLGRSKSTFDSTEDAIARVETHRLRKRLTEFYKGEGIDHSIQVTIPAGSYVPVFIHKSGIELAATPPSAVPPSVSELQPHHQRTSRRLAGKLRYAVVAACVLLVAIGVTFYFHSRETQQANANAVSSIPALSSARSLAPVAAIRLLAGYSGPPRTDSSGRVWNPDQYSTGGGVWQRGEGFVGRTSDPFLFEHSRNGDSSYRIPLKPGVYELHLFFSAPSTDAVNTFNVAVNGEYVLQGFDINTDALGADIADERIFRDISPGKDGFLRIDFHGEMGPPSVNAIEVVPGIPHTQLPIRLITQTTPVTDDKGQFWRPDDYFLGGRLGDQTRSLPGSADPDLFGRERYGHFTYAIPVDTRDTYTLVLHFVEFYFDSTASDKAGRLFKVMCNGQTLLDNFDIFKEAGSLHEISKTFRNLKPTAQGKLNLTFEPIRNNATVSGIEVLDESK